MESNKLNYKNKYKIIRIISIINTNKQTQIILIYSNNSLNIIMIWTLEY